jgi:hypothetical protein
MPALGKSPGRIGIGLTVRLKAISVDVTMEIKEVIAGFSKEYT